MKRALFLFDYTGNMARPWADAGYECYCMDIQHVNPRREGNILFMPQDIRNLTAVKGYSFIAAFPPCDHLAVSGARWFKGKGLRLLAESIHLFACAADICEDSDAPYMIENPVSTISTYWRKWDYKFDPCDYGDPYTKQTCLWTGGGFVMPEKNRVDPTEGSKMHFVAPGPNRKNIRSATPIGFANAVFIANQPAQHV